MIRVDVYEDADGAENPTFAGVTFMYDKVGEALAMVYEFLRQGKYVAIDPLYARGSENE